MSEEKKLTAAQKLDLLMKEIEEMKKANAEKDEKINMLIEVADNARKENWESKKPKGIVSVAKLTTLKDTGKIIVSWRTVTDEVFKDSTNTWHEKQIHEYTDEDGEKHIVSLTDYMRTFDKIPAEVVSRKTTITNEETGERQDMYTVKTKDGKVLELDVRFLN